jgi:hypothetical protein
VHANATAHVATSVSANSKQCVDNLDVATSGDLQTHVVSSGFQEVEKMSVYYEICHSFFFSLSRACRLCIVAITIHDVLASLIDRACKLDSMVFTDTVLRFARFANTKHTHSPHSRMSSPLAYLRASQQGVEPPLMNICPDQFSLHLFLTSFHSLQLGHRECFQPFVDGVHHPITFAFS